MKIILSVDSVKFPLTGIGRYTYELATKLQTHPELELLLYSDGRFLPKLPMHAPDEQKTILIKPNIKGRLIGQLRKSDIAVKSFQAFNNLRNQYALHKHRDAVFHGPNYYLPKFDGPSVATFHDLSVFTFAQYHPPERVRFMQRELKLSLERASMLITDSAYTQRELTSYFGYPAEKIRVIPLACSADFHPRHEAEATPVLKRLGLEYGTYTLFTGTVEPRKNIDALLDAYSAMPEALRRRWPLVISGYHGWQSDKLHERIKAAVAAGWAHYLGFVANEDLPYLYAGARLFVFPSHYEGFGLPVLEAMASGVPVVCSNSSSLPEVVGDAALMCDHDDVDGLQQLIIKALDDTNWRADAIIKGLQQAAGFSWEKCAEQTVAVYRELGVRNEA
jgi:glycosyltransferase involved in cell wall biosynthesis